MIREDRKECLVDGAIDKSLRQRIKVENVVDRIWLSLDVEPLTSSYVERDFVDMVSAGARRATAS